MGLGYLTLAIKSEQDKYLTGNPSFTFLNRFTNDILILQLIINLSI